MKYTNKDIKIAKELKTEGFNWVARDKNDSIFSYIEKPKKDHDAWIIQDDIIFCSLDKNYFRPIIWENTTPTNLDDIIKHKNNPKYKKLNNKINLLIKENETLKIKAKKAIQNETIKTKALELAIKEIKLCPYPTENIYNPDSECKEQIYHCESENNIEECKECIKRYYLKQAEEIIKEKQIK